MLSGQRKAKAGLVWRTCPLACSWDAPPATLSLKAGTMLPFKGVVTTSPLNGEEF